jgi:hypothetical protein
VAIASKQAGKVKKKLQDENVSLGKRHGVELIAKAAIGAVRANRFLLLVRDGEKAFPNIKRSQLLQQINLQAPALTALFQTYYGDLPTSNFMEVNGTVRCLTQVEGVTIGNAAGSFGCCVTLAPMYRMVHEHLHGLLEKIEPGAGSDCHSMACTDDFLSIIPIPDEATEQTMSEVVCKSLDLMNGEGHRLTGVSYAGNKTKLYIPSMMDPDKFDFGDRLVDKRYQAHTDRMKRGFVHVGVPIGTQSFTELYVDEFFEKKENLAKVLPKFPLDAALAVATQVLNPSCFYLTNNRFPTE